MPMTGLRPRETQAAERPEVRLSAAGGVQRRMIHLSFWLGHQTHYSWARTNETRVL